MDGWKFCMFKQVFTLHNKIESWNGRQKKIVSLEFLPKFTLESSSCQKVCYSCLTCKLNSCGRILITRPEIESRKGQMQSLMRPWISTTGTSLYQYSILSKVYKDLQSLCTLSLMKNNREIKLHAKQSFFRNWPSWAGEWYRLKFKPEIYFEHHEEKITAPEISMQK